MTAEAMLKAGYQHCYQQPYALKLAVKIAVRARDVHKCKSCGMTNEASIEKYRRSLDVHRIARKGLYSLENCVALCKVCHGMTEKLHKNKLRGSLRVCVGK